MKQRTMFVAVIITLFLGNIAEAKENKVPHREDAGAVVKQNASNVSPTAQAASKTTTAAASSTVTAQALTSTAQPLTSTATTKNEKKGWTITIPTDLLAKTSSVVFGDWNGLESEVGYRWNQGWWTTSVADPQFTNEVSAAGGSEVFIGYYPTTKLGINVSVDMSEMTEEIRLLGSTFNTITVKQPISIGGRYFPFGNDRYLFIGYGQTLITINGHFSTGGYPFSTTGAGWVPYWEIGARATIYQYKKVALTGEVAYRGYNENLTTPMPNLFGPGQDGQFGASQQNAIVFGVSICKK